MCVLASRYCYNVYSYFEFIVIFIFSVFILISVTAGYAVFVNVHIVFINLISVLIVLYWDEFSV